MKPATLKWLLTVSVAVNLFLVSAMLGATARWFSAERQAAAPAAATEPARRALRYAADGLPAPQKAAFRQRLQQARQAMQAELRTAREGRQELARLFAAPAFDRGAADAAAQRTRSADLATRTHYEAMLLDFASTLAPQERAAFAEGLARNGPLRLPAAPATPAQPANPAASGG